MSKDYEGLSLCIATNEFSPSNKQIIKRMFDLHSIKDNYVLEFFLRDSQAAPSFENRKNLADSTYHPENEAGIWYWYAIEDQRPDYKGRDIIRTCEKAKIYPIEVVSLNGLMGEESAIKKLKRGIPLNNHICDRYLFVWGKSGMYQGILVNKTDMVLDKEHNEIKFDEDTYSVTVYTNIATGNIYNLREEKRAFYRYTHLINQTCHKTFIKSVNEIVKHIILDNITWKQLKEEGFSRADYQKVKEALDNIPFQSLVEDLMEKIDCTKQEAQQHIHATLDHLDSVLNGNTISDRILLNLIYRNEELYNKCLDHSTKIFSKQNTEIQQEIHINSQELAQIRKQINAAHGEYQSLQHSLEQISAEIEKKKELGSEVEKQVAEKIAEARQNAADFISRMAFCPTIMAPSSNNGEEQLSYIPGKKIEDSKVRRIDSKDTASRLLKRNLKHILISHVTAVSNLLFAAYCIHVPILLAGPGSEYMADALAVTLTGCTAGKIDCSGKYHHQYLNEIEQLPEPVIVFRNFMQAGWIDQLPEFLQRTKKYCICTCAEKELLPLEAAGLFNYVIPFFTENVIYPFALAKNFQDEWFYGNCLPAAKKVDFNKEDGYDDSLRKLGLSIFASYQNTALFHEAEFDTDDYKKELYMFGYYPYAYVENKMDKLQELLEKDKSVDDKDDIKEYMGL